MFKEFMLGCQDVLYLALDLSKAAFYVAAAWAACTLARYLGQFVF